VARRIYESSAGNVLFVIAAMGFVLGVVLVFTGPARVGEFIALGSFIAVLLINRRYAKRGPCAACAAARSSGSPLHVGGRFRADSTHRVGGVSVRFDSASWCRQVSAGAIDLHHQSVGCVHGGWQAHERCCHREVGCADVVVAVEVVLGSAD
jgi:hypothetical protein